MPKLDINIPTAEFKSFMKAYPKAIGQLVKNFSRDRWKDQGYYAEGTSSFVPWKKRTREYWSYEGGRKVRFSKGKAILVNSENLRASVKVMSATQSRVEVGSTLKYADRHNEGTKGMFKRTFINDNKKLGEKLEKSVTLLMKNKGL